VITREDAARLRDQLLAVLAEDAHNTERLLGRLGSITDETGIGAHAALLLILTHLAFEEGEARSHWEAILTHRQEMSRLMRRDAGVRVAVLDYFLNVNRRLMQPTLIDLEMVGSDAQDTSEDRLTGLATDRRFRAALQVELRRARRYEEKVAVVVADVDGLAEINARLGVLVGDRLLRELAILARNNTRDIDLAARPGEDEVALLLPATDRNGGFLVAERFRREVEAFFSTRESGGRPVELTVSAGVACYPDDATSPEAVLERAAQALYQAKASGRNTVRPYQPERRRFLRFDLEPGRFEVEVLRPSASTSGDPRNLSRNGLLFESPEPLEVGEEIEIRLVDSGTGDTEGRALRVRGQVVRLEALPPHELRSGNDPLLAADETDAEAAFEVGMAFDLDWLEGTDDLLEFLDRARRARPEPPS
jgi:diguanylate cyclase (GGDEF)-like protein